MRPWAEKVYGIPPEQVVGSSVKTKFEVRDGRPVLVRLPDLPGVIAQQGFTRLPVVESQLPGFLLNCHYKLSSRFLVS